VVPPRRTFTIPLPRGAVLSLGSRCLVMGILNVTPDSFADTAPFPSVDHAVDAGLALVAAGADLVDLGGESTRPGADPVSEREELSRVLPVVERLAGRVPVPISIDTSKASVARAALAAGAGLVNDVTGLRHDPSLGAAVADAGAALVLMHMRGTPKTMAEKAVYRDLRGEVVDELAAAIRRAVGRAVPGPGASIAR